MPVALALQLLLYAACQVDPQMSCRFGIVAKSMAGLSSGVVMTNQKGNSKGKALTTQRARRKNAKVAEGLSALGVVPVRRRFPSGMTNKMGNNKQEWGYKGFSATNSMLVAK